jgi:hypothetical protein
MRQIVIKVKYIIHWPASATSMQKLNAEAKMKASHGKWLADRSAKGAIILSGTPAATAHHESGWGTTLEISLQLSVFSYQ